MTSLVVGPAVPEAFLFITATLLLGIAAFLPERRAAEITTPVAVILLLVTAMLVVAVGGGRALAFGGHFVQDEFAAFLKVLTLVVAAGTVLVAPGYLADERMERFEYPMLALFSALGMMMMISANSLLALYMAIELHSLPLYVMAAIKRDSVRAAEAGLKYFVLGALASGLLLYGASLVYGFTGTLMFDELAQRYAGAEAAPLPLGALVGLIFLVAGFAFKLAAVPFHMWTPDVYEGAPTPVTAFVAAAPKLAAVGLTLRVLFEPFGAMVEEWRQVIVLVALGSMILGAFAAIGQSNIKRLMAYSTIGHVGYAFVGLAAGSVTGVQGVLVYMAIYAVMTLGTFACILMMRRQGRYVETLDDLAGLSRSDPLMALAMALLMFSLAGIPPLAGFFAKLYVFLAAVQAGLTWLAVVGVLTSVVAAYYYIRIVKLMYFDEPAETFDRLRRPELQLVAAVSAAFVALFVLWPTPLLTAAEAAARVLVGS